MTREMRKHVLYAQNYGMGGENLRWLGLPHDVTCKPCRIKGTDPECSRCAGTAKEPIPYAEVMNVRAGNG